MKYLTKDKIYALHKKYALDGSYEHVVSHCEAVAKLAVKIGSKVNGVDLKLIETGALIHDIGRHSCPPKTPLSIRHGITGGLILKREKVDNAYVRICEKHLGAGISKKEIVRQGLNLPKRDFVPMTKEEKIITHADNLIKGTKVTSVKFVVDRFTKEVDASVGMLVQKLADEVESMMGK